MSIQRLGYMGFEVADVPAWRSFVTSKLGAMEASANEAEATFRIDSRTWRLSVSKGTADDYLFAGSAVDSAKGLHEAKESLEAHGVTFKVEGRELDANVGVLGLLFCCDTLDHR